MSKITLSKIEHRGKTRIKMVFEKKPELISKIKSITGRRWSATKNCWHLPYSSESFKALKNAFGESALIFPNKKENQSDDLQKATITNPNVQFIEYQFEEKVRRKVVGDKIFVRKPSPKFIEAYVPYDKKGWLEVIRNIPGRQWNIEKTAWVLPNVKETYWQLKKFIGLRNVVFDFKIKKDIPESVSLLNLKKKTQKPPKFSLNEFQTKALCILEEQLLKEHKSWRTIKTYKGLFIPFLAYFPDTKPSQISKEQIEQYLIYKKQHNISDSSINQWLNALNCFYIRILKQEEKVIQLRRPRKKKKLPNVFSLDEIEKLLKSTDNIKHKCMLILVYSAGLRKSEVLNLRVEDLSFDRNTIFIKNAKGGKDRFTFFADSARKFLKEYFKLHNPKHYLFEGQTGGRYSESSLQNIYNAARKKANVNRFVTLHGLRHSFATHLVEKGVPLHVVQELLGHNSIKTTEIYLHISNKFRTQLKSPLDDMNI